MRELLPLRPALRAATPFPLDAETIEGCLDDKRDRWDALFRRARAVGLAGLPPSTRSGHLPWRVVGEVAESVAELVLADLDFTVFAHHRFPALSGGVVLLLLCSTTSVLALEVKGTLRGGAIAYDAVAQAAGRSAATGWIKPTNER